MNQISAKLQVFSKSKQSLAKSKLRLIQFFLKLYRTGIYQWMRLCA